MDLNSTTTSSSPTSQIDLDDSYRPLPSVYLAFLAIWAVSGFSWGLSSWRSRHFQVPFLFHGKLEVDVILFSVVLSEEEMLSCYNYQFTIISFSFF